MPLENKDIYRYSFNTEFRIEHHDPWSEDQEFHADWAQGLMGDPRVDSGYYIYAGNTPIDEFDVAIVENGNVRIPLRHTHEGFISQLGYTFAQIFTSDDDRLRHALDMADLEISDRTI